MPLHGALHHVSLEISDVPRSKWFHDRFLGRLGYRRFVAEPGYLGYTDGTLTIWLLKNRTPRIRRRPPTGEEEVVAEHLAFRVPRAAQVRSFEGELADDELYALFSGEEHPEFRAGYFSATWVDPDGIVLEVYAVEEAPSRRSGRSRRGKPPAHRRARRSAAASRRARAPR